MAPFASPVPNQNLHLWGALGPAYEARMRGSEIGASPWRRHPPSGARAHGMPGARPRAEAARLWLGHVWAGHSGVRRRGDAPWRADRVAGRRC